MFGLFSTSKRQQDNQNGDVARLFFDLFSKRVEAVEETMRRMTPEIENLKILSERGQISDLVLLEKLQKVESLVRESLVSIEAAIDNSYGGIEARVQSGITAERTPVAVGVRDSLGTGPPAVQSPPRPSFIGELGSLQSITTPTELQVLTLLSSEGPKSAPEIGRLVGRSREHTARLMKKLFQEGYIRRDQTRIPFRYSVVEKVRQTFRKTDVKDESREAISVPQT